MIVRWLNLTFQKYFFNNFFKSGDVIQTDE